MTADVVIRGGTVVDGTGAAGRVADVAVTDGHHLRDRDGPRRPARARRLGPDGDAGLHRHPHALRRPGVLGPGAHAELLARRDDGRRRQLRLLDRARAARTTASCSSARCSTSRTCRPTRSSPACRGTSSRPSRSTSTRSRRAGTLINFACYVGHTAVRIFVMGEAGYERAATDDEIRSMQRVVAEAMDAGAAGFATSSSPTHNGDRGRPVPSRVADLAELCALLEPLRDAKKGVAALLPGEKVTHADVFELQRAMGRPLTWTALLTVKGYPWHEKIMEAQHEGARRGHRGVAPGVVPAAHVPDEPARAVHVQHARHLPGADGPARRGTHRGLPRSGVAGARVGRDAGQARRAPGQLRCARGRGVDRAPGAHRAQGQRHRGRAGRAPRST